MKTENIDILAIEINSKHKGNKTEGRVETRQEEELVPGEKRNLIKTKVEPSQIKKKKN